jgi:cysteine synthase/biotin carboxylase
MRSERLIDAIGNTPLVRLRLGADRGVEVYAKLELQNLFAMKDRVARQIILEARADGTLQPGAVIVESSSGTMALGVALVGTWLGHPVHIVTDPRIDRITLTKLRSLGCEVHVVPKMDAHGWQGARLTRLAEIMAENPGAFWPKQYENPQNPAAYRALAEELRADLGTLDVVVGSVGSGGSLCGTSRVLREWMPGLRVVGVDCVGSVLFDQPDWPKRLQSGLGNSLHPKNLDRSLIDEIHWLSDAEAFGAARDLAREEKVFAGNTSGSVYRILSATAERSRPGTRVVGIFPDRGDRYAETVHDDDYWNEHGLFDVRRSAGPRQVVAGTTVRSWAYRLEGADAPRPFLVFVEANTTGTGMLALGVAESLGFVPVLLANDPSRYAGLGESRAVVITCDTNDPVALRAALFEACPAHRIAGLATTSEFYQATTAALAAEIGVPGPSAEAVRVCRDKGALREVLGTSVVPQPRFAVARDAAGVRGAVEAVGLPCVVKPVDDSGSTRVRRCDTTGEALAQAEDVLRVTVNGRGQPTARAALVEEYLPGPEFSVETFGTPEGLRVLGIVEKWVTGEPGFVEVRHVLPADLPPAEAEAVAATVREALDRAGLTHGPSHTEVKLTPDGPAVVEINPRLAGGMIPELFRLTTGVDLLEAYLRQAAGLDVTLPAAHAGYAGIQFLLAPSAGVLTGVEGVDRASAIEGVARVTVTARTGHRVNPPRDAYDRLGHVIAVADSRAAVLSVLHRAVAAVDLRIKVDEDFPAA